MNKNYPVKNTFLSVLTFFINVILLFVIFYCMKLENQLLGLVIIFLCMFLLIIITIFIANFNAKVYIKYITKKIQEEYQKEMERK